MRFSTAKGATHMNEPAGNNQGAEMIKVRLQGTKEDMQWFERQIAECEQIEVICSSEAFRNKGTKKYFRKYLEVTKKHQVKDRRGENI